MDKFYNIIIYITICLLILLIMYFKFMNLNVFELFTTKLARDDSNEETTVDGSDDSTKQTRGSFLAGMCKECPPNSYVNDRKTGCNECPPNSYVNDSKTGCNVCPPNSYVNGTNTGCECESGQQLNDDNTTCVPPPPPPTTIIAEQPPTTIIEEKLGDHRF